MQKSKGKSGNAARPGQHHGGHGLPPSPEPRITSPVAWVPSPAVRSAPRPVRNSLISALSRVAGAGKGLPAGGAAAQAHRDSDAGHPDAPQRASGGCGGASHLAAHHPAAGGEVRRRMRSPQFAGHRGPCERPVDRRHEAPDFTRDCRGHRFRRGSC